MRVTDEMVEKWLVWARNFGEVVAYRVGSGQARRFRVRLPAGITRDGAPCRPRQGMLDILGHETGDVVPTELMLTAREALVFAYGCAAGRAARLAGDCPMWFEPWSPEAREQFEANRQEVVEANLADLEREAAAREAARLRRMAEHRRRREGTAQITEGGS
jgi:hypothetical protein